MLPSHRSYPHRRLTALLPLALLLLAGVAAAPAQTVIDHLPYTITTKGLYVLNQDLKGNQTSGVLIEIKASNVTLDFQGHFIAGAVGNTSQSTTGIYAYEQSNLTIKNGTVAYCSTGIVIVGNNTATTNAVDEEIDHMRVTYCYYEGIRLTYARASTITNCKVSQTGYSGATGAYGIVTDGAGTIVQNCVVDKGLASASYGILSDTGSFARQNTVSGFVRGITYGKYQDNLTYNCTYPFSNGTDAGGNN